MLQFGVGSAVGDMDFMLQQPRSFSAEITSKQGTVYMLTRKAFDLMMAQRPLLAMVVHSGLLKTSYLATAQYLEAYT
jgi:CRP-like cAMP-binding protein